MKEYFMFDLFSLASRGYGGLPRLMIILFSSTLWRILSYLILDQNNL